MVVQALARPPSGSPAFDLYRVSPKKIKGPLGPLEMYRKMKGIHSRHDYDVFLSFRGPDTREGFTDHLHKSLTAHGFHVFKDDRDLLGEQTGPGLLQAIDDSKIVIPIISKNYGKSKWCLQEIVRMVQRRVADQRKKMFPIFYDVDVSDVYNQTGEFGKGFSELAKRHTPEQVEEWKEALRSVARIGGWSSRKVAGDGRLVSLVVEKVSSILSPPWIERIPTLGKRSIKSYCQVFPISSPATKKTFASHLPYHLERENINVFRDDDQYLIGKDVDLEIRYAMDHCKIFIPIISEDFASSPDCLNKLVQMFKCVEKNGQTILPIFYGVDFSQKKELLNHFWVDMLRHDVPQETRQRWLESLDRVCSIAGFVSENIGNGNGGELAEAVLQQVIKLMRSTLQLVFCLEVVGPGGSPLRVCECWGLSSGLPGVGVNPKWSHKACTFLNSYMNANCKICDTRICKPQGTGPGLFGGFCVLPVGALQEEEG